MSPTRYLLIARRTYSAVRFLAVRAPFRFAIFSLLALWATWNLLATASSINEFRDAQVLAHYESVARSSILRWHQAPLWDPYYCGGMYLLGTPQARFVSPTFLLSLLFGESRGEALTAFSMILIGLEGTFRYARTRGATSFAALLTAPVFALSGIFAVSPALGWVSFFSFELLPWMALGIRRTLAGAPRGMIVAAVAGAWCVGIGGTYAAPMAVLWCAFEGLEFAALHLWRRPRRVALGIAMALTAGLLAAGLAAIRLWPIAETLRLAPRVIGGAPSNTWEVLMRMLFHAPKTDTDDGEFFIGWLVIPAALLGLPRRRSIPLAIALYLCVGLAAGYVARPPLFAWLRELPIYTTLRYPERFLILAALAFSGLAARGVSLFEAYVRVPRTARTPVRLWTAKIAAAITSIALIANVGPMVHQHALHADDRSLSDPPTADATRPFHQARGNRWGLAYYEPMQRGSLSCWEAYPVPESPQLRGDLEHEEYLSDASAGAVIERSWSPNAIDLDVVLSRPATLFINQNWHSGWHANVGEVVSDRGLISVRLPAGTYALSLRFVPRSATGGALASLGTIAVLVLLWRSTQRRRSPMRTRDVMFWGLAALIPFVPLAATAALVHESAFVQPAVAPDGAPIVTDDINEGAVRIDTKFAAGVTLEAATLSNPDPVAGTDVMLELDWQRDVRIDPGLGVFVHIEPSSGKMLNGDHVLISSVLDFDDAPPGKTLRDIIPLYLPPDAGGKTWKVWLGLWGVRRDGQRVKVVDPGHAVVERDRVLAASFVVQ